MADPIIFRIPNPDDPKNCNTCWFEWGEEKDQAASDTAGIPVFDTVLTAFIQGPGLTRSISTKVVERKKHDGTVKEMAPAALKPLVKAFKEDDAGALVGTPLTELAILDTGLRATLKANGVPNLEALAEMAESSAPQFIAFRKYKMAAQAFLDQRAGQAPLAKLTAELDAEREKTKQQDALIEDLAARLKALEGKSRKAA